jgi:hypothetical protein
MTEKKICPNCGAPIQKLTAKYCGHCGATLDETQQQPNQKKIDNDRAKSVAPIPKKYIAYAIIALVAIVAIAIIIQKPGISMSGSQTPLEGRSSSPTGFINSIVEEKPENVNIEQLSEHLTTPEQIQEYMVRNFKYKYTPTGALPRQIDQFLAEGGKGDYDDFANFFVEMLAAQGYLKWKVQRVVFGLMNGHSERIDIVVYYDPRDANYYYLVPEPPTFQIYKMGKNSDPVHFEEKRLNKTYAPGGCHTSNIFSGIPSSEQPTKSSELTLDELSNQLTTPEKIQEYMIKNFKFQNVMGSDRWTVDQFLANGGKGNYDNFADFFAQTLASQGCRQWRVYSLGLVKIGSCGGNIPGDREYGLIVVVYNDPRDGNTYYLVPEPPDFPIYKVGLSQENNKFNVIRLEEQRLNIEVDDSNENSYCPP